jgi:hypothetical protein
MIQREVPALGRWVGGIHSYYSDERNRFLGIMSYDDEMSYYDSACFLFLVCFTVVRSARRGLRWWP